MHSQLAQTLNLHVDKLCRSLKVEAHVTRGRGRAKVKLRKIQYPPIKDDEMAYFIALHELGHIVIGMHASRLEREALAWEWALKNAIIEPHYSTRQRICANLIRYLFRARENDWGFPDEDSAYWRLLRWWEVEHGEEDGVGMRQLRDGSGRGTWRHDPGDL